MIGKLRGIIDSIEDGTLIIDVGGVGYAVFCAERLLSSLLPGAEITLVIETNVREDHIHLYGFRDEVERKWFRILTSVQRVGSKLALVILSALNPEQLAHAILAKDTRAFSQISGVGPKLAERIVGELKDKAAGLPIGSMDAIAAPAGKGKKAAISAPATPLADAVSALEHLGYSRSQAYAAASRASAEDASLSLDQLIKHSLKELSPA